MNKKNIKVIIFTINIIVILTTILILGRFAIKRGFNLLLNGLTEIYVFADIAECEGIAELDYPNATVTRRDTPDGDKKLKGLAYESFYSAKFVADGMEFEIFAYEFVDSETAQAYFKNVTGKGLESEQNFSSSTGLIKYRLCVLDGNLAYTLTAPNKYADEIEQNILPSLFSKKIGSQ